MGLLVERGGMARELYRAAFVFLGHRKGGLAMSTIALRDVRHLWIVAGDSSDHVESLDAGNAAL